MKKKIIYLIGLISVFVIGIVSYHFMMKAVLNSEIEQTKAQIKEAKKQTEELSNKIKELNETLAVAEKKTEEIEVTIKTKEQKNKEEIERAIEIAKAQQSEQDGIIGDGPSYATEEASNSNLSLDEMRKIAKEYVDNWNGYDNLLRDEWDLGDVRVYEFKDGPAERSIGLTVNYKTGEVTPDQGMF